MVTKTDVPAATLWLINASNGRPEEPPPNSGEVIQLPQVQTAAGPQALASLAPWGPGDDRVDLPDGDQGHDHPLAQRQPAGRCRRGLGLLSLRPLAIHLQPAGQDQ